MENATNFSPPETRVEVVGHKTKADGYVISVTDHGIGMSGDQVTEANDSLARPPLVGLAMSRSLGFIVVGRLASRHGIAVRMMPSAAGGVTAVVSIPPALVVDTPGGMGDPPPAVEAPARLKPVLDSPTSGLAPLSFNPADLGPVADADEAPSAPAADAPPPAVFAPPAASSAAPATPAPVDASALGEPVAWPTEPPAPAAVEDEYQLPTRSIFDTPPDLPADDAPSSAPQDEETAAIAAQVDEAVSPAVPAALSFEAPPATPSSPSAPIPPSVEAAGAARLDGPPPRAPQSSRPFFLEDAEPPRAFGHDGAPAETPAPPAERAPAPARLFGGPTPSAPSVPPASPDKLPGRATAANGAPLAPQPPAPLAARRPAGSAGTPAPAAPEALPGTDDAPAAPADSSAPPADAPPPPTVKTTAGLAKRVPRSAGATRAIPGSETERGVAATRRSPEEIRSMLKQHSAGRQRARVQEPVPAGTSDERDTHE
ncbi:ATP-binding protein [Aquihabitans daechungensis]|uniref:ATP-binding protein n=1 Tax=Aquihabitans daechungensis TaxID=1052257 RepID=UPI003B9E1BF3